MTNSKPTGKPEVTIIDIPGRAETITLCEERGLYSSKPARNMEIAQLLRAEDLEGIYGETKEVFRRMRRKMVGESAVVGTFSEIGGTTN
jgi:hypothetical protein